MSRLDDQFSHLIQTEGLGVIKRLLTPRQLDEVPLVSRLARIDFLANRDVYEKSRLLLIVALRHLANIIASKEANERAGIVVVISIPNWHDLRSTDPEPVIPRFWICTNPARDLAIFRLKPGTSEEARQAVEWLRSADLLESHDVFDPVKASTDPDLRRVYVAPRPSPAVEPFVVR
jgi:hypothetical protein